MMKETAREKILEMIKDADDKESALIKLMKEAEALLICMNFGGFTFRKDIENMQELYQACESLLEEARKEKQEV